MNISSKKDTTKGKKINIPVWNKILKIWDTFFEFKYRSTMQQKLVQIFLHHETGAFGNNIGKEPSRPRPKLKNMYIFTENICSAHNPMQVVVFCKLVLILYNSDSNFLTLKVA